MRVWRDRDRLPVCVFCVSVWLLIVVGSENSQSSTATSSFSYCVSAPTPAPQTRSYWSDQASGTTRRGTDHPTSARVTLKTGTVTNNRNMSVENSNPTCWKRSPRAKLMKKWAQRTKKKRLRSVLFSCFGKTRVTELGIKFRWWCGWIQRDELFWL